MGEQDDEIQKMKRMMSEDEYARMVLAKPIAPQGLVFKEFSPSIHVVPISIVEPTPEDTYRMIQQSYSPFNDSYSFYVSC